MPKNNTTSTKMDLNISWERTLGLTNDILMEKEHRVINHVHFYTPKQKALPKVKVIKEEPGMEEEVPDAVEKEETEIEEPELNNDDMEL